MNRFHWLLREPPWGLALTAAAAGAMSFWVGAVFPGPAGEYPYYAPLGAVVAMSSTVVGSVRTSIQSIACIWLGSAIALITGLVLAPTPLTVAIVIGVGMIVGSWRRLGEMGLWVPTAGLFVLIIGTDDPVAFVSAYGGLTLIGATIGVAMTVLFPQLPLAPAERAMRDVRAVAVIQLQQLAGALQRDSPPTASQWADCRAQLGPALQRMRTDRQHVLEASRVNRRRSHHRDRLAKQLEQAARLERVCFLVEDLTQLLEEEERAENDVVGLGPPLRPYAAQALLALAEVVRSGDGDTVGVELDDAAQAALSRLVDQVHVVRSTSDDGLFTAGSIVTNIRRCLKAPRPVSGGAAPR